MILGFKQQLNGKPTYFAEKIWKGIDEFKLVTKEEVIIHSNEVGILDLDVIKYNLCYPKFHTIITDKKNRWKSGNLIHPYYNVRQKDMIQFAPTLICVSTQKIEMRKHTNRSTYPLSIYVDDKLLTHNQTECLALSDGFDSIEDFFKWFNEPYFIGKIIHWTKLKY